MKRAAVLSLCARLPGATRDFPFGPDNAVFKVGGKMFAIVSLADRPGSVSLKCDPGFADLLRTEYPAVTAGYHLDKRHWNTVELDGSVPSATLREWTEDSHALVVAGLPRAVRATIPVPEERGS